MILAFYYHIPAVRDQDKILLPGYLGVFVDALAKETTHLYLLLHEGNEASVKEADYALSSKNITWINLGYKTPAWHRDLFHSRILKNKLKLVEHCDAVIIRSPSPLAPYFPRYINKSRLIYMIVGDYGEEASHAKAKNLREWIVWRYIWYNDVKFRSTIKQFDILVNSPLLLKKYTDNCKSIHPIRTTTLSQNDFFERNDTCQGDTIHWLFTGRIDPLKGLFELIEALKQVRDEGINVVLNIVGWETDPLQPVEKALIEKAVELEVSEYLIFHGKKSIGDELNSYYRKADIYVIPSYHEGFPRTIWEAMANSLPVVASAVGGIPDTLVHNEQAILIAPRSVSAITTAMVQLVRNADLRQKLISAGQSLARENTLERQSKNIVSVIKNIIGHE